MWEHSTYNLKTLQPNNYQKDTFNKKQLYTCTYIYLNQTLKLFKNLHLKITSGEKQ